MVWRALEAVAACCMQYKLLSVWLAVARGPDKYYSCTLDQLKSSSCILVVNNTEGCSASFPLPYRKSQIFAHNYLKFQHGFTRAKAPTSQQHDPEGGAGSACINSSNHERSKSDSPRTPKIYSESHGWKEALFPCSPRN